MHEHITRSSHGKRVGRGKQYCCSDEEDARRSRGGAPAAGVWRTWSWSHHGREPHLHKQNGGKKSGCQGQVLSGG